MMTRRSRLWSLGLAGLLVATGAVLPAVAAQATPPDARQWEFTSTAEGWSAINDVSGFAWSSGAIAGTVSGPDSAIVSPVVSIDIESEKVLRIRLANATTSSQAHVFFTTAADGTWDGTKSVTFSIAPNSGATEYVVDMSVNAAWAGELTQVRIDPQVGATRGSFSVSYVGIHSSGTARHWDFTGATHGWTAASSSITAGFESAQWDVSSGSATLTSPALGAEARSAQFVALRAASTSAVTLTVEYQTQDDPTWSSAKSTQVSLAGTSTYEEHTVAIALSPDHHGIITALRLSSPTASTSVVIDYLTLQASKLDGGKHSMGYFPFYHYALDWDFDASAEGWTAGQHITGFSASGAGLSGTYTGSDPVLFSPSGLDFAIANRPYITFELENDSTATSARLYFITDSDATWNATKSVVVPIEPNSAMTTYVTNMSAVPGWSGQIEQLRLDPQEGATTGTFTLGYLSVNDGLTHTSTDIPYDQFTILTHAFQEVETDGDLITHPRFDDPFLIAEAHANDVDVLMGVISEAATLGAVVASPTARANFVEQVADYIEEKDYDGVDLDWEYPSSVTDMANYVLLVNDLRDEFELRGRSDLSIQVFTIGFESRADNYDYIAMLEAVDYFTLAFYDMHGPWSAHAGHNAPLFEGQDPDGVSVELYLNHLLVDRQVPGSRILGGVPFYGWEFSDAEDIFDSQSSARPVWSNTIAERLESGWTRYWDSDSQVPYLRNDNGPGVITYDDEESIPLKVDLAVWQRGLAGAFVWEISQDFTPEGQPLLDAFYEALIR